MEIRSNTWKLYESLDCVVASLGHVEIPRNCEAKVCYDETKGWSVLVVICFVGTFVRETKERKCVFFFLSVAN